jgi:hypothetical protein
MLYEHLKKILSINIQVWDKSVITKTASWERRPLNHFAPPSPHVYTRSGAAILKGTV